MGGDRLSKTAGPAACPPTGAGRPMPNRSFVTDSPSKRLVAPRRRPDAICHAAWRSNCHPSLMGRVVFRPGPLWHGLAAKISMETARNRRNRAPTQNLSSIWSSSRLPHKEGTTTCQAQTQSKESTLNVTRLQAEGVILATCDLRFYMSHEAFLVCAGGGPYLSGTWCPVSSG